MVQPSEIYLVESVDLGKCKDARPCLVLYVSGKDARICCLSAQMDLAEGGEVTLLKSDPDFTASGLKRSSYIPMFAEYEIPVAALERSKRLGAAQGGFKKKVENFFGISF